MIFTRRFSTLAAMMVLASAAATDARGQALLSLPDPPAGGRLMIDGYLSQYRLSLPETRATLDGMGARVLFALAPASGPRRERVAEHIALGGFVATTPQDGLSESSQLRTTLYGAELDVLPLRAPIAGIVEPVLSLGAGVMRVERTHVERLRLPGGQPLRPHDVPIAAVPLQLTEREAHPILAPAIGVLLAPRPDFALRVDVRRLESPADEIGRGNELQVGVSLRI